jgi:Flp pilus assembly protein TadD
MYYEDFMSIDSTNPRIVGNIADVYRKLGQNSLYFRELERAVRLNTADPGVYSNLGVEYAMRGDTAMAIELNRRAIRKNPTMQKAYANLGILLGGLHDYAAADQNFTTAMRLGMREPLLYRYSADVCVHLGDYRRAIEYYDTYLNANPGDKNTQQIRRRVYEELMRVR